MRYMLDTNICICLIKNRPESVIGELRKHKPEEICISSVTYAELSYGVEKSKFPGRNRIALVILLSNIEILPFGSRAGDCCGRVRSELERNGTPIGALDMMIAGHAISENCTLVTNNLREFEKVQGLNAENWVR